MESTAANRFANAFLAKDWDALGRELDDEVVFRALVPPGVRQAEDRAAALAIMSGWFGDDETVTDKEITTISLPSKERVNYRFSTYVAGTGTSYEVEQHVYLTVNEEGRVATVDLICSGWMDHKA